MKHVVQKFWDIYRSVDKKLSKDHRGQAAIEFITIIVVVFFFLFFYMSMAMLLVLSEYVDYATFMTARTYRSSYTDENTQVRNANLVFNVYMSRIEGLIRGSQLNFVNLGGGRQTAGVSASYSVPLFYLPPIFTGTAVDSNIVLESESYLGREPSRAECLEFFSNFNSQFGLNLQGFETLMADNAC